MGAAKPSPHAVMGVRRFQAGDFAAYRRWYADPLLDRHLGPMDDEWLADVLADTNGEEWAVLADGVLLAVVGLTSDSEVGCWVITDFAVDPRRRGQGWGRRAWQALCALPALKARPHWRAYVADDNPQAQAFFEAQGWRRLEALGIEDGLWTYCWQRAGALAGCGTAPA